MHFILTTPSPRQASQRPPFHVKAKAPLFIATHLASGVDCTIHEWHRIHLYRWPDLERGVRPIGLWSILMILSYSKPLISLCSPTR